MLKKLCSLLLITNAVLSQPDEECKFSKGTYVCTNIINKFPPIFYGKYDLQCVDCHISVFTKETFPVDNSLLTFNVSNSGIRQIREGAFSNLLHIEYLYLNDNYIVDIAAGAFSGLKQLFEVHLQNNKLNKLNPGFLKNFEVSTVDLSGNKIETLPNHVFDGSLSILSLDLSSNQITKINPDAFVGLDILEHLDLRKNKLCHLPLGVFRRLITLRSLNLADNKFSMFQTGTFSGLVNLNTLILANNSISVFDGSTLLPFMHITKLDITGNGLYYLDAHSVHENAPTLRFLHLGENLYSCTLLMNIIRYFKSVNVEVVNYFGRYDVRNVNGIACIETSITESISYGYFWEKAVAESKMNIKFC